ncbi:MAG TPA: UDP-N-acetylglucosamine--N-acetylmuramyl-(pentapeptide) pyrophosphoryl-undecaprenol N-acetylglucosamine transferase [Candidatus Paceibacterota bacterium]|nr:UDP-N-acetylglucosamine--N-acetylmuramyl-(pentapeptide) pyrophosphoryl-undecaprenol N-acetylglucosamine transferase [Candidatus Paceibacterota bacterium]
MKILLTGGGTGGHFYPIVAVAESIRKIAKEEKLLDAALYYMAPSPYDERALFEYGIVYKPSYAGKVRRYFSLRNVTDLFKTAFGVMNAVIDVWNIYPDVVFGKGGYVSFPVLFAARLLGIPVVIHESDSHPGRVNLWAGRFAQRVAVSYREAGAYFPASKVAFTGNPVRKEVMEPIKKGARDYLKLDDQIPVVVILGGSQGSKKINEAIIGILPELVKKYYVIHQTGKDNIDEMTNTAAVILNQSIHRDRYKPFAYLNVLALRMAAGAASVIISRAGSTIFEIALWQVPSIVIPIPEEISHDQTSNAYAYAAAGGCSVIEEVNLTPHVLAAEIDRLIEKPEVAAAMRKGAQAFAHKDAADKIAREILKIALEHTK